MTFRLLLRNWFLGLVALGFIVWELVAKFDRDEHTWTLSRWLWELQDKFGWPVTLLTAVACALLFTHLVFRVP